MKSITEFPNFKLIQGLTAKTALSTEGKTPEEISVSLGEKFKFEGDKLKHFLNAIEVAGQNLEKLGRVVVVSLAEGESAPPKATKVEETYYIPEFQAEPGRPGQAKTDNKGGGKGGKKGKGGPRESPWGLSPEEKAAKKNAGKAKANPKPG